MKTAKAKDERLDSVFRALAHPTRRDLLSRLMRGSATVSELAAPYEASLPTVSKHIRVLEQAGLVQREVSGRVHRCRIDRTGLEPAEAWIRETRSFWTSSLDGLAEYLEDR